MRKLWSRRITQIAGVRSGGVACHAVEPLEPRVVLDGTPGNPAHPVVEVQTSYGNIYIELFPEVAPETVENFLGYVERGDYDGTFFHRHVRDFVIQGGGYAWDEENQTLINVVEQDPVVNEFELSNLKWTVAMAKLGDDPNSATSEWFINLEDNSDNLDNQNGGFTVFGEVIGGRDTVALIEGLEIANFGGAFSNLPVTESYDPERQDVLNTDLVVLHDVELVYDPDNSLTVDPDGHFYGVANQHNRTNVVVGNLLDRAIMFEQNGAGAGWTVVDLNLKTETGGDAGPAVTWIDSKDSKTYAAAISDDGLILYERISPTVWTSRNLNQELIGAERITSSLTVFVARGGSVFLAGLTANGELMLFNQTGQQTANGDYRWTARNLSDNDLADRGETTPEFVGGLASYVTSWNGLNIVGLDADGDVHGVWWAPGQGTWQTDNLSDLTGAPPMQGSLAPYLTRWNAINLAGTNLDGDVVVTWWVPNGLWTTSNLTDLFDGPQLEAGSVATYVTPWGGTNVLGRDVNGRVAVYWWSPGLTAWNVSILSEVIDGAEVPTSNIIGFSSPSGTVNLFGADDEGGLIRYWWKPQDVWRWQKVTDSVELV